MKIIKNQIMNIKDLKPGKIYNKVYTGDNKAYGRINGKSTIEIVYNQDGIVKYQELYSTTGSAFKKDLRSGVITCSSPDIAFKNYEIKEVSDESEYFIHNQLFSLDEAISQGLIELSALEYLFRDQSKNFVRVGSVTGLDGKPMIQVGCEGKSKDNPFLQTVTIVWGSWGEMRANVKKHYQQAWFL